MTQPADGQLVPETSELLRLPRWPRDFDPAHWRPSYEDFQPSSTDKKQAEARGKPVRVSVWDHGLTTVEQARSFRATPALVVIVENRAIAELAQQRRLAELRTVYDLLSPPDNEMPGAAGHAAIEGLDKTTRLSKLQRRELQEDIARRARLHPTCVT
jgi:hypothetical protein